MEQQDQNLKIMIKLICALVGESGNPFPVDIEASQLLGDLSDAIKAKNLNSIECDAGELQLYTTKHDGAFLNDENTDLAELSELNCSQEVKPRYLKHEKEMKSSRTLDEYFDGDVAMREVIDVLVVVPKKEQQCNLWLVDGAMKNALITKGVRRRVY